MGNLCRRANNIVGKKYKKLLYVILNYMKPINLLYLIRECSILILISVITFICLLIFSVFAIMSSLYEILKEGFKRGFRRDTT